MTSNEPNQVPSSEADDSLSSLDEIIENKSIATQGRFDSTSLPEVSAAEEPVGIDVQRERTRAYLAYGLLALLGFSLFGIGLYIIFSTFFPNNISLDNKDLNRELITIIWTSQVTLVSGALGFYFGSERSNNNSD